MLPVRQDRSHPIASAIVAASLVFSASPAGAELAGHGGSVKSVAISSDGRFAASASFDNRLILWNLTEQVEVRDFDAHEGAVNSVAFLPGADRLVSGSDDGTVRLWDAKSGALLHTFEGHQGKVAAVAVSSDGRLAASAGWDRSLRLWDLEGRTLLRVLEGHKNNVNAVAFSPGGTRLLSGSYDTTLRLWREPPSGTPAQNSSRARQTMAARPTAVLGPAHSRRVADAGVVAEPFAFMHQSPEEGRQADVAAS